MSKLSDKLIDEIRCLQLPLIMESALLDDVRILTSASEKASEVYTATKLSERRALTRSELFRILEKFEGHGKIKEWVKDDVTHIYFAYIDNKRGYHAEFKEDGIISIGRHSNSGINSGLEFNPVREWLTNLIVESANSYYGKIVFRDWTDGIRRFDYSPIIISKIEGIEKYLKDNNNEKSLGSYLRYATFMKTL